MVGVTLRPRLPAEPGLVAFASLVFFCATPKNAQPFHRVPVMVRAICESEQWVAPRQMKPSLATITSSTLPFHSRRRRDADAELRGRFVLDGAGNARLDLGGEAVELTAQCRVGTAAYTFIEGVEQGQQDQIAKAG